MATTAFVTALFLLFCAISSISSLPRRLLDDNSNATSVNLVYHNGTLLASPQPRPVHLLWYGAFTSEQKSIMSDFLSSFSLPDDPNTRPSVSEWWKMTEDFFRKAGRDGRCLLNLTAQASDPLYELGKVLARSDIETLLEKKISAGDLPLESDALYVVLTADDVHVERFCLSSCGYHAVTGNFSNAESLMYAWIGNPGKSCPGRCAWPFAVSEEGPQNQHALIPPSGDVGMEGMIINLATILAGMATNPYNTGFYEGDPSLPMEAVSACTGFFGKGSFPGYPGELLVDKTTGASYNAHGYNNREFLLPSIFNPSTQSCWIIT